MNIERNSTGDGEPATASNATTASEPLPAAPLFATELEKASTADERNEDYFMNLTQEQIKCINEFGDFSISRDGKLWSLVSPKITCTARSWFHCETGDIRLGLEECLIKIIESQQGSHLQGEFPSRSKDSLHPDTQS